jgi:hypothetical protein
MSSQNRVQVMEQMLGQFPILCNTIHDELDRSFLVMKNVDESRGFDVGTGVRDQILGEAMGNECLCCSTIQIVYALQNARLDAQAADQSSIKLRKLRLACFLEAALRCSPTLVERTHSSEIDFSFLVRERPDGLPFVVGHNVKFSAI